MIKETFLCNDCGTDFELLFDPDQVPAFCAFCGVELFDEDGELDLEEEDA